MDHPLICPVFFLPELGLRDDVEVPCFYYPGNFCIQAEAPLSGVIVDFTAAMTTKGLSQIISGLAHSAKQHTLDLVFCSGHEDGDLRVEELPLVQLS